MHGVGERMKEPLYVASEGILKRKENTLFFVNREGKKALPVDNVSEIYAYGKVTLTSGASSMLMKMGIPLHFFNMYGWYEGSLYPRVKLNSGLCVVRQAEHYLDNEKRIAIAQEFINGTKHNILATLKYYRKQKKDVDSFIEEIEKEEIEGNIDTLRSCEGRIWAAYYKSFGEIVSGFELGTRDYRPPTNELNALISFGNSLLYSTALSEIYNTYLHPSISFLHEPSERRFSLALDIADIFKPIIVERVIFKLVNNRMLTEEDFDKDVGVMLKDKGKRLFLKEYQEKLATTISHPELKKKVSYKYLIRLECYKLIKHILGDKRYSSLKMWW